MKDKRFDINDDGDLQRLLREADCVPPAPDCRSAVMSKIQNSRRGKRPWLYALGSVPAAMLVLGIVLALKPMPTANEIVIASKPTTSRQTSDKSATSPPALKMEAVQAAKPKDSPEEHALLLAEHMPEKAVSKHRLIKPKKNVPSIDYESSSRELQAKVGERLGVDSPVEHPENSKPVILVAVTRPSADELARDECDFSYTQYNTETGETTHCSGKRSGNSIVVCLNVE